MLRCLQTPRLLLRPYEDADQDVFVALNTDPVARQHMDGPLTPPQAEQRFAHCLAGRGVKAWAATLAGTGEYLGHVFLLDLQPERTVELGYILHPGVWKRGYGTEMACAVMAYAQRNYRRVVATVDADNSASIRVLEKAGLSLEREEQDAEGRYLRFSWSGR